MKIFFRFSSFGHSYLDRMRWLQSFEDRNSQNSIIFMLNRKNQRKWVTKADDLYNQAMKFKNHKIKKRTYVHQIITTFTSRLLKEILCLILQVQNLTWSLYESL